MDFLVTLLGTGFAVAIIDLIKTLIKRKWDKQDKKSDQEARRVTPEDFKALTDKVDHIANAQKVITTERIRYLALCYIGVGYITMDDKETLKAMHRAGKDLGLNGDLDVVMEEVNKLPVRESRYKRG